MHYFYRRFHIFFRRVLQDAVADVENVTRASFGPAQHVMDTFLHFGDGRKQGDGIKVALYGSIMTDSLPALVKRDSPIEADHIAASLAHQWE